MPKKPAGSAAPSKADTAQPPRCKKERPDKCLPNLIIKQRNAIRAGDDPHGWHFCHDRLGYLEEAARSILLKWKRQWYKKRLAVFNYSFGNIVFAGA
jgi:hypothetical protein